MPRPSKVTISHHELFEIEEISMKRSAGAVSHSENTRRSALICERRRLEKARQRKACSVRDGRTTKKSTSNEVSHYSEVPTDAACSAHLKIWKWRRAQDEWVANPCLDDVVIILQRCVAEQSSPRRDATARDWRDSRRRRRRSIYRSTSWRRGYILVHNGQLYFLYIASIGGQSCK